ncbi:hypothetical protein KZZ52_33260 [Dactylosporangium sp. AC04546]|uniref:hypothetical protein n=1 Tax=Dactylosporangium sp. AC04546 TaxID=2862460 RepID=UPI001EDD2087|nr:hypothetical protein [Dactylosporangium sp. AC04546]WVK89892.1 hypothetical protein KZZ52_33260 [Dactylosporangium sp. AC04546]
MVLVHVLQERDYRYGVGVLRMRVERVYWAGSEEYDGERWYLVEGVQLNSAGAEVGHRQVTVRGRMLQVEPPAMSPE